MRIPFSDSRNHGYLRDWNGVQSFGKTVGIEQIWSTSEVSIFKTWHFVLCSVFANNHKMMFAITEQFKSARSAFAVALGLSQFRREASEFCIENKYLVSLLSESLVIEVTSVLQISNALVAFLNGLFALCYESIKVVDLITVFLTNLISDSEFVRKFGILLFESLECLKFSFI